ncbi:IPT/TIG domain-containing protein [Rapidithrix thailandica]|uniref:IPT/TIG domain-containing protein n=1 Tax=Rapidithrix thailandica TaxID=413964 RepID=A0AAW9SDG2_9BACT
MLKFNNLHSIWMTVLVIGLGIVLFSCEKDGDEDPVLRIESIEPLTARVGEVVLIKGKGFDAVGSQNTVLFSGEVVSPVFEASSTALKVLVPEGAQNGPLTVKVGKQSAVSSQEFTLDTSLGAPSLTGITPANGIANSEVTVNGTGFGSDASLVKVYFAESEAEITTVYDSKLKVKVPVLDPGVVQVRVVREEQASNTLDFTVDPTPVNVRTVYWTATPYYTKAGVYSGVINEDGADIQLLYETPGNFGVALDREAGMIYWSSTNKIYRAPLDGTGTPEVLFEGADGLETPYDIVLDLENKRLFVANFTGGDYQYIMAGNMDGTGTMDKLYALPADPSNGGPLVVGIELEVANDKLYWTEAVGTRVVQGSVNGEASQAAKVLFDASHGLKYPVGLAVDSENNKIYITDATSLFEGGTAVDNLYMGSLDGSGSLAKVIAPGDNFNKPFDVELDLENGYVFWITSERETGQVMRCKLDGSDVEVLFAGDELGGATFFDLDIY